VVTIRHIIDIMEGIAPSSLAEAWDNIGLQVGHDQWPVDKIWVALDATDKLVDKASVHGVNFLITHHPLIYQPISALDPATPVGRIIAVAAQKKLGIFCAHTNLDSARGGLNDMLAECLGIETTRILRAKEPQQYKLVVFVPEGHERKIANALFESGAGQGEKYTHVSFRAEGVGTFRPGVMAKPLIGETGEVTHTSEYRIEVLVPEENLPQVSKALHSVHPYEEVVYDLYAVAGSSSKNGLGRLGELNEEISLGAFVQRIKKTLGLQTVKVVGNLEQMVKRVALCSGSGKGLLPDFFASDAHVYVTGDLGYHDGRSIEDSGRSLIDIGHFASEHMVVEGLVARLKEALSVRGYSVQIEPYREEKDCYQYV
jgi:dinuclear metal center YbgI/SA1388 family protein